MEFSEEARWYLPRITRQDGPAIEQALAAPSLFDSGLRLDGAVVEASYAAKDPPLLRRLAEDHTAFIVDPQTSRFVNETFLSIEDLAGLPYAPDLPLAADLEESARRTLVRHSIEFQDKVGAAAYVVPALPVTTSQDDLELNLGFLRDATDANGSGVERRPLVAMLLPDRKALASPDKVVKPLADIPLEAVYVQPTRLHPTTNSVEHLVQYVGFLMSIKDLGLSVIAGRVGAFGLVLQALGINHFDSGLGDAESFDLKSLNRKRVKKPGTKSGGGRNRRIYLEMLKTTLMQRHARAILDDPGLRARFVCNLRCCRFKGFDLLEEHRREHYLHARTNEVARLRAQSTQSLKINHVYEQLAQARDHAEVVRRVLGDRGLRVPSFAHLDRWLGCLARAGGMTSAA